MLGVSFLEVRLSMLSRACGWGSSVAAAVVSLVRIEEVLVSRSAQSTAVAMAARGREPA